MPSIQTELPGQVLINNAAAAMGPFTLTVDGLENQFATDHVGPFLFTKLLAPKLLAAATASYTPRVVFVSSNAHAFGKGVDLSVLAKPDPAKYTLADGYFQAKSANILAAIELAKRAKGKLNAYSLHPGSESSIQRVTECGLFYHGIGSHLHEYRAEGDGASGFASDGYVLFPHFLIID